MKLQLEKYDRICFLGDSITANGLWIAEIADFFVKNYPELEITMFNAGIGSTRGCDVFLKDRIYRECLNLFPKYVVIMFGMNDMGYSKDLDVSLAKYLETLASITNSCKGIGAEPIICSPTPYDEYNEGPSPINEENEEKLARFTKAAEQFAEENGFVYVDMRSVLLECMADRPISDDRVHPAPYGNHLMAQSFLYAIEAIDVIDTDGSFEMSEKNRKRYEIEQILREYMFIDLGWQKNMVMVPLAERKKWVNDYVTEEKEDWEKKIQRVFNENADFIDELRAKLLKLTFDMYR